MFPLVPLLRALGFLLAVASGGAFSLWMQEKPDLFRFDIDQVHHLYWGILLLSTVPAHSGVWPWWVLALIFAFGAVLVIDDAVQHHVQVRDPSYQSPIHRIFVGLWLIFD